MGRVRVVSLAILLSACSTDPLPCSGLVSLDDFTSCRQLCSAGPDIPACDQDQPSEALDAISMWHGRADEMEGSDPTTPDTYVSRTITRWIIEDAVHPDRVGIRLSPGDRVVLDDPAPRVRATWHEDETLPRSVTIFLHVVEGRQGCALHRGVTARFLPRPDTIGGQCVVGGAFHVASLLLEKHGLCQGVDAQVGDVDRREGLLLIPTVMAPDVCDIWSCAPDGICNTLCRVDVDCPCHTDGVCDPESCIGDMDCGCEADHRCIPGCTADPDCACIEDGTCNVACGDGDPDCDCLEDGRCDTRCLADDPDCGCGADGVCTPSCGLFDPDCACLADGLCNADACGPGEDPDCGDGG